MSRNLAILTAALLAGCATATMDRVMQSWQSEHIDQVVKQWGYPNAEREFRGRKLYVWNDSSSYIIPSSSSTSTTVTRTSPYTANVSSTTTTGGGTFYGQCERILEVDGAGLVVGSQWSGNNCCVATIAGHCSRLPNPARQ